MARDPDDGNLKMVLFQHPNSISEGLGPLGTLALECLNACPEAQQHHELTQK